jgi:hypothetical protein
MPTEKKSVKFKTEQHELINTLFNLLPLDDSNSFILDTLKKNNEIQQQILNLIPDIKKYFNINNIHGVKNTNKSKSKPVGKTTHSQAQSSDNKRDTDTDTAQYNVNNSSNTKNDHALIGDDEESKIEDTNNNENIEHVQTLNLQQSTTSFTILKEESNFSDTNIDTDNIQV